MDGQGPEHSSCRIERFLELMDDNPSKIAEELDNDYSLQIQKANMQVCNPSFSANYFHLLLRQIKRQFRKPLIIPAPKKLLRFKQANSNIEDYSEGLKFMKVRQENLDSVVKNAKNVKKLLICSGQVYYDLINRREKLKRNVIFIYKIYYFRMLLSLLLNKLLLSPTMMFFKLLSNLKTQKFYGFKRNI
jgi:2-oxoglutarate dehydrogenase E1 component